MLYLNKMYYGGDTTITCYGGSNNSKTCPKDSKGYFLTIDETSKSLIDNHTWNTGGVEDATRTDTLAFYQAERGEKTGKICTSGTRCNDTVNRTTTWTGYVALPYVTDYAYASSESDCNTNMVKQDSNNVYICKNNNWMHRSDGTWYLSPYANSGGAHRVWFVRFDGDAGSPGAYCPYGVAPAMYLKSNVLIESGNGREDAPYKLKLDD